MKKIFTLVFTFALFISAANAQFFSLQIGDSKARVMSELKSRGLQYVSYNEKTDTILFVAKSISEDGEVIGSLPKTEDNLAVIMVQAVFNSDKLSTILLQFSEDLKMDIVSLARLQAAWEAAFEFSKRSMCLNNKYKDWIYADSDKLSNETRNTFYNLNKKTQYVRMIHDVENQNWYLTMMSLQE